ncbi:hypothetical protein [Sorangium sp. So ce381]|uniref:hypothetical protein n=1 Tax=Sorangium sp. So ce381 TaxID=3133307 RepID=UPI003F5BAC11
MKNDIIRDITEEQDTAKKKGTRRQPFRRMSDSEIDAEATRRLKSRFDNPNLSIETFQRRGGKPVNPCDLCQQMFADLGISHAVVGEGGKRGKFGPYKPRW